MHLQIQKKWHNLWSKLDEGTNLTKESGKHQLCQTILFVHAIREQFEPCVGVLLVLVASSKNQQGGLGNYCAVVFASNGRFRITGNAPKSNLACLLSRNASVVTNSGCLSVGEKSVLLVSVHTGWDEKAGDDP